MIIKALLLIFIGIIVSSIIAHGGLGRKEDIAKEQPRKYISPQVQRKYPKLSAKVKQKILTE